jgi:nucleoside-diphosphate-sugar epimerase
VADVVEATTAAMQAGDGTYNVGGGVEVAMVDAIAILERLAGRELELRRYPAVPGDQRRTLADTTRIERELGWRPRVGIEEGLAAQWEWAAARVAPR